MIVKANRKKYKINLLKFTPEIAKKALAAKMLNGAKMTTRQTNLVKAISKIKTK